MGEAARRHRAAADLQRDVRRGPAHRRRLRDRLSARAAGNPGPRRFDRRDAQRRRAGRPAERCARDRHHLSASHRSHRLQGWRARSGHEDGQGRVRRHLRRRLHPDRPTSCGAPCRSSSTRRSRWCRRGGDTSTRTTRCSRRSSRSCSTGTSCSNTAPATAPATSSTSTARRASGAASAIVDAGGWQHDTLTEDLDLSYRAQLRGWKFVFLPDLVAPAEVPVEMNSFKSQQHRWAKGSIQTCRKLLPRILRVESAARA